MSYCQKCGNELKEGALFCESCGYKLQEKSTQHNGLGVTALILSIVGFLTAWLYIGIVFDIVAIALAIILLKKAKKANTKSPIALSSLIIAVLSIVTISIFLIGASLSTSSPNSEIKEPEKVKATIVNNDGETEQLTSSELYALYKGNSVAFEAKYDSAQITIVDNVKRVDNKSISLEEFNTTIMLHSWLTDKDTLISLKSGDKVEVIGLITTDPILCISGAIVKPYTEQ